MSEYLPAVLALVGAVIGHVIVSRSVPHLPAPTIAVMEPPTTTELKGGDA